MKHTLTPAVLGLMLAVLAPHASARVKLITLPVRERVEVQLDHDSATLVEEERIIPLVQGSNQVDFAWAGTRIDPGTIVFRVMGPAPGNAEGEGGELVANVLSVSYPPGENALVWDVSASRSGSALVRISYLLGGLDKSYNYRAVAEHDEKTLTLAQYIRVQNFAGEEFDAANVNLGIGDKFAKPIGLNETKEILVDRIAAVPILKTYTADPTQFGYIDQPKNKLRVPMHYVIHNDKDHKLGSAPLPYGKVRIFQKDRPGEDATTAFLGEDWGSFTPIDDKMRLYLGVAQDIVVVRTIDERKSTRVAGNLHDFDVVIKYEVENFKDQPVLLNLAELVDHVRNEAGARSGQEAQWEIGPKTTLKGGPDAEDSTHERIVFKAELPPRKGDKAEKLELKLHLVFRNQW